MEKDPKSIKQWSRRRSGMIPPKSRNRYFTYTLKCKRYTSKTGNSQRDSRDAAGLKKVHHGISCYATKHGRLPCLGGFHVSACSHPNLVDNFNHLASRHLLSKAYGGNLLFLVPSFIPCAELLGQF